VVSFGGTTREYQVLVDPNKLVSYGLSLAQVEQALAANNVNARGQFHRARPAGVQHPGGGIDAGHRGHRRDGGEGAGRPRRCACGTCRWSRRAEDPAGTGVPG